MSPDSKPVPHPQSAALAGMLPKHLILADMAFPAPTGLPRHPLLYRARGALRALADLVFPPACASCGAATADTNALCAECWRALAFIDRPFCERLGTPFAIDVGGEILSPAAIATPPPFARARAAVAYDGVARTLVHRLKYGDRLDLAPLLARMMRRAGRDVLKDADLLIPVPLHRGRLWRRRFNQAAALADALARLTGVPSDPHLLRRVKPTRSQVGLTRPQRKLNLSGALRVPKPLRARVKGRKVVVVDDVLTTGSTAEAAARVLRRAGAARVDVIAFAMVVGEG